jgi:hypothetical protein
MSLATNARMFVSKLNAQVKNTNLNLNEEISHECTNVRVQIKRLGEKYELKFERSDSPRMSTYSCIRGELVVKPALQA